MLLFISSQHRLLSLYFSKEETVVVSMAVEARHLTLSNLQLLTNRNMMNAVESNGNMYAAQIGYGLPPLSGTTTDTPVPMYGSVTDTFPVKTAVQTESGLSYALPVSRKRSRDSINPMLPFQNGQSQNYENSSGSFTFLGEDMSLQIQRQQLEMDRSIFEHTVKVRRELEEWRKRNSGRIIAAVEGSIMKMMKAKEDEIEKIGKLNWMLEEKVRSLCEENNIWRDLAQANEATANALRCNLEQVLSQVHNEQQHRASAVNEAAVLMDDAQSCCGSNYIVGGGDEDERRTLALHGDRNNDEGSSGNVKSNRWCRNCGKVESTVLLLPCRHLCLCTVCGSSFHSCPVCKCTKEASVHVNLSS